MSDGYLRELMSPSYLWRMGWGMTNGPAPLRPFMLTRRVGDFEQAAGLTSMGAGIKFTTLENHLAQGRPPLADALRLAVSLAEQLRKLHDSGQVHGALSPASILVDSSGVKLLNPGGGVTVYSAPEVIEGKPADARSDIYSFGVVLFELLTGRAPFEGGTSEDLAAAVEAAPPSTGSTAADRLVRNCLARDPATRWARTQKILLELKLLTVVFRRAEQSRRETAESIVRGELQQTRARLESALGRLSEKLELLAERVNRIDQAVRTDSTRIERLEIAAGAAGGVLERLERSVRETVSAGTEVTEELRTFQSALKTQSANLESARTEIAQTDDLVERVVEALDSLQSAVLDPGTGPTL